MTSPRTVHHVSVFPAGPGGGNPAPIVVDAEGMTGDEMQAIAKAEGHEAAFVLPPPKGSGCDFRLRFFVPNHEMEMCGHATLGAVWLLDRLGRLPHDEIAIATLSGPVRARVERVGTKDARVEISQPKGRVEALPGAEDSTAAILSVLKITDGELAPLPILNAATSRVKTLIPLKNSTVLDGLTPDFEHIAQVCERIGSTGLYPFAVSGAGQFDARQFPKASGYPEDPATGIAAAALAFGLLEAGLVGIDTGPIRVRQGRAMGRPSLISVRFESDPGIAGCWLGGLVEEL